ncbi:hypothetical protein [Paenibacillus qinlingensis]|uniref:hypothetical protein n=1 Tax=Paenibacillus qinlingensis TaxID=1837343 RepID=UPI001563D2E7|nr:hypothetical protein [Paenibacillus qinlingensis]NQX63553.1 hypothetical protein [Paenibacillus qinlingensis]
MTHNLLSDIQQMINLEPMILFLGDEFEPRRHADISKIGWSCVFTTQMDPQILNMFSSENRKVQPVYSALDLKDVVWSKTQVPLVWLFGDPDYNQDRKSSEIETEAENMFNVIKNRLKEFGRMACVGFDPNHEVIGAKALNNLAYTLKRRSLIYFLESDYRITENRRCKEAIEDGFAVSSPDKITDLYSKFAEEEFEADYLFGDLDDFYSRDSNNEKRVFVGGPSFPLNSTQEKETLFYVSRFATLLDYDTVEKSVVIPREMRGNYFKSFLKNSAEGEPLWYGFREEYQFHIHRYFEDELYDATIGILKDANTRERKAKPIMLCGQACSGKSNALGALAVRIFRQQHYPVIYIKDPSISFSYDYSDETGWQANSLFSHLEDLVRILEEKTVSAVPVLIIWDLAAYSQESRKKAVKLLNALRSRGRKVQIVCSSYEFTNQKNDDDFRIISTDVKLREGELEKIKAILHENGRLSKEEVNILIERYGGNENFLASLYIIDDIRSTIGEKVFREVDKGTSQLVDRVIDFTESQEADMFESTFANAIKAAYETAGKKFVGFVCADDVTEEASRKEIDERFRTVIVTIAICTWYGQKMPYILALRMMGGFNTGNKALRDAISSATFLSYEQNDDDNWDSSISVRTELESKILLEQLGINPTQKDGKVQILDNIVSNLLRYVSCHNNREYLMIRNILQLIGPNNNAFKQKSLWEDAYEKFDELIDVLKERRVKDRDNSLVLQEITLRREYCLMVRCTLINEEKLEAYKEALEIAEQQIREREQLIVNSVHSRRMDLITAQLKIEKANLNNRIFQLPKTDEAYRGMLFDELFDSLQDVLIAYPTNGYAYTPILHAGLNQLERARKEDLGYITRSLRQMYMVLDLFQASEDSFSYESREELNLLRAKIGMKMDQLLENEDYFNLSVEQKEPNGIYLKACNILRDLEKNEQEKFDYNEPLKKKSHLAACETVIELLEKYYEITNQDPACLFMHINIKWLYYNRSPLFGEKECRPTRLNAHQWQELLSLCESYFKNSKNVRDRIRYLTALCSAQLGDFNSANAYLKPFLDSREHEKRALHLICDEDGVPLTYHSKFKYEYDAVHKRGYMVIYDKNDKMQQRPLLDHVIYRVENIHFPEEIRRGGIIQDIQLSLSYSGFQAHRRRGSYKEMERVED